MEYSWLIITIVSLVLSALFSGSEMAFVTADRVRVELDVKRGGFIGKIINWFYSDSEFFISSILVGNNVVLVIYGMGAAYFLNPWIESFTDSKALMLVIQTLISTGVILLVGEFLPKTIFRIDPNNSLKVFAPLIFFFYVLFYPISRFASWLSMSLMRLFGAKSTSTRPGKLSIGDLNDYLEETIDSMEEKKETVESEVKIFQNALDFSETHLRDCMTPRNEIVAANINETTRDELSELFTRTGRSKIIVYDSDIDDIVGYIHVSELFDPSQDWRKRIKPVIFAPETLLANKMMRRMLKERRSIAIVVDEFGGMAGLVTLEDLVEEIFGEIQDEHDKNKTEMRQLAPGLYECSGRCEIEQINEAYGLDIPEADEYQTVAGYIFNATGAIPAQGETIALGSILFTIIKKTATRLELIQIRTPDADKS